MIVLASSERHRIMASWESVGNVCRVWLWLLAPGRASISIVLAVPATHYSPDTPILWAGSRVVAVSRSENCSKAASGFFSSLRKRLPYLTFPLSRQVGIVGLGKKASFRPRRCRSGILTARRNWLKISCGSASGDSISIPIRPHPNGCC
jgi:hypothetical protein